MTFSSNFCYQMCQFCMYLPDATGNKLVHVLNLKNNVIIIIRTQSSKTLILLADNLKHTLKLINRIRFIVTPPRLVGVVNIQRMAKRLGRLFSRLTRWLSRADVRESGDEINCFPVTEAESKPSDKENDGMVRALICIK